MRAGPAPDGASPRELVRGTQVSKFFAARRGLFERARLVRAVEQASIHIDTGETVGLVGESGSGKTTLGRLLLRLLEPNFGRVWFDGVEITHHHERDLRALRRSMQMLFQDAPASLDDHWSTFDIIEEPLCIHAVGRREERADRVRALIAQVGLDPDVLGRRPSELSSGQCQRICIARALSLGPRFVVCDEPLGALDVDEQLRIMELLGQLSEAHGHSYLFISHDVRLVARSCRRIYVMYAGRIVETLSADAILGHARHPYTRALANAIPELDPKRRRLRVMLQGEPPSPFKPLGGCPFHPRCPRAEPGLCDREAPELTTAEDDDTHEFACWHPV